MSRLALALLLLLAPPLAAETALVVPEGANAVRVLVGDRPATEPEVSATVSAAGAERKATFLRNSAYILPAKPGDRIAISGPADFAPLLEPVSYPADRAALAGANTVSGTAACDAACIPWWWVDAPHVTLPAENSAFTIAAEELPFIVYLSERTASGAWTPARFEIVPPGQPLTVFSAHREVAIANDSGRPLSIAAPAGSTIGGRSGRQSLGQSAAPRKVHRAANAKELAAAIAAAVSGDAIELAPGTYALEQDLSAKSFAANIAAGRVGGEGIAIRGTGTREAVVLQPSLRPKARWTLDQSGAKEPLRIENLTISVAESDCTVWLMGGRFALGNVRIHGPRREPGDVLTVGPSATDPIFADFVACQFDTSTADVVNGAGNRSPHAPRSVVRLINCLGFGAGTPANSQVVTTHTNLPVEIWGGEYFQAPKNVFAPDSQPGSTIRAFFARTHGGSVAGVAAFACSFRIESIRQAVQPKPGERLILTSPQGTLQPKRLPEGFAPAAW